MSDRKQEMRQHLAKRPWRYGLPVKPKGPPRFDNGMIKPRIWREA